MNKRRELLSREPLGFSLMASPEGFRRMNCSFSFHQVKAPGKVLHGRAASVSAKEVSGKGPTSAPPEKTRPIVTPAKAGKPEKETESSSEDSSDSEDEEPVAVMTTPQVNLGRECHSLDLEGCCRLSWSQIMLSALSELCTHLCPF